jgi:hypothetical protein
VIRANGGSAVAEEAFELAANFGGLATTESNEFRAEPLLQHHD